MPPPPNPPGIEDRVISLPLSASKWVNLRGPFPMTEKEWLQMKAVLEAMKPGLVIGEGETTPS